jgi:hypothetical protein
MRRGLIDTNPARHVELPPAARPKAVVWTPARVAHWRATGDHPIVAVWTAHQSAHFLHHIRQHRLYPLFRLITLVGLRRGEACALRWCDIDLQNRTLVVCRQLQQHAGELTVCDTKTPGSVRLIALDRLTVTVLHRHQVTTELEGQVGGFVSPTSVATRSNPTGSASCSSAWSAPPACPRSGCMTCVTARPACPWPPVMTSKPCRRCWATPASCSPPTPTPACCPTSPTTPPKPPHG